LETSCRKPAVLILFIRFHLFTFLTSFSETSSVVVEH
jgi:hypothetical protein